MVIPAHDEQAVVVRCLTTLLADASPQDLRVVVVSNGSTDATAARAREVAAGSPVQIEVVELARPSKIEAVREGIRRADGSAVLVLDADIELPTASALAVLSALDRPQPVVASARLRVDASRSSWWVRHYYRAWTAMPYVSAMVGSGVFALNPAALAVMGELPDVVNDDGWVNRRFPAEQRVVVDAEFVAHAARTTSALVARRARIINGNRQLDGVGAPAPAQGLGTLAGLVRGRTVGPADVLAFVMVTVASRLVAAGRRARGSTDWSTDRTSRVGPEPAPSGGRRAPARGEGS